MGDCSNKASVSYSTEDIKENLSSAVEGDDYEPIKKAELEFNSGELEKQIQIKLVEKSEEQIEEEEIYLVFRVTLFDP